MQCVCLWQGLFKCAAVSKRLNSGPGFMKETFVESHKLSVLLSNTGRTSTCIMWFVAFILFDTLASLLTSIEKKQECVQCAEDNTLGGFFSAA